MIGPFFKHLYLIAYNMKDGQIILFGITLIIKCY